MRTQTRAFGILVAVHCSSCDVTGPDPMTIHIEGHVINRENSAPVSATVRLTHEVSDGDWVWTSYRTIVDATTQTDATGWYEIVRPAGQCGSFTLQVEASGFRTFANDRITCADGVQKLEVYLDPAICIRTLFGGCRWVSPQTISLLTPEDGAVIRQNDPAIGCPAHPTRGYGFRIAFAWAVSPPRTTARYRLVAKKTSAINPLVDVIVSGTEYVSSPCNSFVADTNLEGWEWWVEALDFDGDPVPGTERHSFTFAPCRLASGAPCFAN